MIQLKVFAEAGDGRPVRLTRLIGPGAGLMLPVPTGPYCQTGPWRRNVQASTRHRHLPSLHGSRRCVCACMLVAVHLEGCRMRRRRPDVHQCPRCRALMPSSPILPMSCTRWQPAAARSGAPRTALAGEPLQAAAALSNALAALAPAPTPSRHTGPRPLWARRG